MNTTASRKRYASFLSGVCQVCYSKGLTEPHHIVPISSGGPDSLNNVVELCLQCHSFAHNYRANWRKKAREGIAKAKAAGRYKNAGRKSVIDVAEVNRLLEEGYGATEIARIMGIGRASVYRLRKEYKNEDHTQ
ncbi:HNH endonuclease [Sulfitobacter sp.]|jgi:transposase-like protein|nr:HNH endonuclease [Sulfitobacter sp.]